MSEGGEARNHEAEVDTRHGVNGQLARPANLIERIDGLLAEFSSTTKDA